MASTAVPFDLSDEQRLAIDHAGLVVVRGGARSGKTTTAMARWHRRASALGDPARVLLVCRDAPAARAARSRLLQEAPEAGAALPVTSPWALAFDVISRSEPQRRYAGPSRHRAIVADLVASLPPDELHDLSPAGVTAALIDELADLALAARPDALDDAAAAAAAQGAGARWRVAAALLHRYHHVLDTAELLDASTLMERAAGHLTDGGRRFDTVIVDDVSFESGVWGSAASLVQPLSESAAHCLVTIDPEGSLPPFASEAAVITLPDAPAPARRKVLACHHRSVEGEAVAGLVLDELRAGRTPEDIVVVCRTASRASRVARALSRHGIPVGPPTSQAADDPHVRGLLAMLRWVGGDSDALGTLVASPLAGLDADARHRLRRLRSIDEGHPDVAPLLGVREGLRLLAPTVDVARLAHAAFAELGRDLVAGPGPIRDAASERALDACTAFVDDLIAEVELDPTLTLDRYLAASDALQVGTGGRPPSDHRRGHLPGTVRVAHPDDLRGGAWPVVVACGAVEGELPRITAGIRYFDRALLEADVVPEPAERRAAALAAERRLFRDVQARATAAFVAVAPTEPGVLMSRFLSGWPCEQAAVAPVERPDLRTLAPTTNGIPLHPDASLRLSASQLDTYAECPRRYLYEYPLRVRGDANVWADFGTLVHDVLEAFIGRDADEVDLSWERLVLLAEEHWTDDIAEYRPQREELRRDLMDLLRGWWEAEGSQIGTSLEVLAAERAFSIEVGDHTVTGRIDRVDRADDGAGIRILDYKTSKRAKSVAEVADDLQLRMYHLAALRDPVLAELGKPSQLRLLFLRDMKARDQQIRPDHEDVSVQLVSDMAELILAEAFEPRAGDHCNRCDVRRLCPLWPEGREAGTVT